MLRGRERLEALADADVVVYPSEHEVFGLVPLEAILSGTPVVVADDSGCAEVVGAIDGGQIVPLGDAAALADAIERVLEQSRALARGGSERRRADSSRLRSRRHLPRARKRLPRTGDDRVIEGVSFVVPVHNGAAWIRETIYAIFSQADGRPMEVIVVDDHSRDDSIDMLKALPATLPLRLLRGEGRGAAAAINTGVRAARFPIVCQVDQDVLLEPNWMRCLTKEFDDPAVVATQGYYVTAGDATMCARAMSLDLEQRYAAIRGGDTDHVCSGNSAYRVDALRRVGLFDESLGYGYDNDVSYRLRAEGIAAHILPLGAKHASVA